MNIINFYRYRISAFIFFFIVSSIFNFSLVKDNLNLGIDFKGGILIEANFKISPDLSDLREKLIDMSVGNFEIQEFGSSENILIRIEKNSEKKRRTKCPYQYDQKSTTIRN